MAFLLFLLLAAPLEFNLAAYFGEADRALLNGALYFFAVTVAIESWMRLETHPELAGGAGVFFLKLLLLVPIGLFVLDFVPKRFGGNPAAAGQWQFQGRAALLAGLAALVTHAIVESVNESRKRALEK